MGDGRLCALITGAGSGIGRVYAEHLAQAGYDLILVGSRLDRLEHSAQQLVLEQEIQVQVVPADLEREDGVQRVADRIENGRAIDILVNSAGSPARGRTSNPDPDALGARVRVNIVAMSRLCHSAMIRMLAVGSGHVINIAPTASVMWRQSQTRKGAFRSFTVAFTRHLQMEAEGTGVNVQLLVPGVVTTEFPALEESDMRTIRPREVITPSDLVGASLRALKSGELICCPLFPAIRDWESYITIEHAVSDAT